MGGEQFSVKPRFSPLSRTHDPVTRTSAKHKPAAQTVLEEHERPVLEAKARAAADDRKQAAMMVQPPEERLAEVEGAPQVEGEPPTREEEA
jgi:hypothetical protein